MTGVHDDSALERATTRRVSARLLPLLFLGYVCAHVDRTNVGLASLQMNRDLGLSAAVYGFGASIFYIGYGLFEVPSNLALARVGARRWIARIMLTWGLLASAMMLVRTPLQFYALRFLLGVAEGGFFPGVVFYLGNWFPAAQRARAISRFMVALPIAAMLSGALAGPLLGLRGKLGLAGWQWLFLVEGVPPVLLGLVVLLALPDAPAGARWLDPAQREWLVERLRVERERTAERHRVSLRGALTSGRVWQLGVLWSITHLCANAYTFWAPQIIKSLTGRSAGWVGDVMAVVGVGGAAAIVLNGLHSDRSGERWLHVVVPFCVTALAWLALALGAPPTLTILALGATYLSVAALYAPFWCLPSVFLTGEAAAGGLALISSVGAVGGFLGPNVLGVAQQLTGSPRGGFVLLTVLAASAALLTLRLRAGARREQQGDARVLAEQIA